MQVSTLTIIFTLITIMICIGGPIGLLIYFRKKTGDSIFPFWIGALSIIVFTIFLKGSIDGIFLDEDKFSPAALIAYIVFSTALFEELCRFVVFKFILNKYKQGSVPFFYGIGHVSVMSVLAVGIMYIQYMMLMFNINNDGISSIVATVADPGVADEVQVLLESFCTAAPVTFLLDGISVLPFIVFQICASILVYIGVNKANQQILILFSFLLHMLLLLPQTLYNIVGFNRAAALAIMFMITLGTVYITNRYYQQFKADLI